MAVLCSVGPQTDRNVSICLCTQNLQLASIGGHQDNIPEAPWQAAAERDVHGELFLCSSYEASKVYYNNLLSVPPLGVLAIVSMEPWSLRGYPYWGNREFQQSRMHVHARTRAHTDTHTHAHTHTHSHACACCPGVCRFGWPDGLCCELCQHLVHGAHIAHHLQPNWVFEQENPMTGRKYCLESLFSVSPGDMIRGGGMQGGHPQQPSGCNSRVCVCVCVDCTASSALQFSCVSCCLWPCGCDPLVRGQLDAAEVDIRPHKGPSALLMPCRFPDVVVALVGMWYFKESSGTANATSIWLGLAAGFLFVFAKQASFRSASGL
eukprot:scaffold51670_cov19-Tisochrysis_lutea.AAC.1